MRALLFLCAAVILAACTFISITGDHNAVRDAGGHGIADVAPVPASEVPAFVDPLNLRSLGQAQSGARP